MIKATKGVDDFSTLYPKLAKEWHIEKNEGLLPSEVTASSGKKVWWKCSQGHEWQATLDSRNKGHGCPYCSRRRAVQSMNDLLSLRLDIAKFWHPTKNGDVSVSDVTVASGVKYWWLGECGHEWQTKVSTMCDKNTLTLCPVCSSQNRTSFPEQAIFYYLKKMFSDTVSRYGTQRKEIDV